MKRKIKAIVTLVVMVLVVVLAVGGLLKLVTGKNSDVEIKPTPQPTAQITPQPAPTEIAKPQQNEFTTLVNVDYPLDADHPVETRAVKGTEKLFDIRAVEYLENMLDDAATAGYPMYLVSTYRTIAYQEGLFQRKVNKYLNLGYTQEAATQEAAKWVAVPGTSEHNLGLAADIVSSTWYNNNTDLTHSFEETEHFKWLSENCYKYGFILRYTKDKEAVTHITYEPWHYRYVGVEVATYLTNNALTLEEFILE